MKLNWKFSLITMAVMIGLTLASTAVQAPEQQPEKLNISGSGYDSATQSFFIEISAQFGIARAGERAGFTIETTLIITDLSGNQLARLTQEDPVRMQRGTPAPPRNGMVPLEPIDIPWDREGGTLTGTVIVSGSIELINPGGETISNPLFLNPIFVNPL